MHRMLVAIMILTQVSVVGAGVIQAGDCDGDGDTTIVELQSCVGPYLSGLGGFDIFPPLEFCEACDADGDGDLGITDLQGGVNCFLDAEALTCPHRSE